MTDVVMPVMNWREVVPLVRQKVLGRRVRDMSGYSDDAFSRDAEFARGEGFLRRPFSDADLATHVYR